MPIGVNNIIDGDFIFFINTSAYALFHATPFVHISINDPIVTFWRLPNWAD